VEKTKIVFDFLRGFFYITALRQRMRKRVYMCRGCVSVKKKLISMSI